jgi:hypothetical protein
LTSAAAEPLTDAQLADAPLTDALWSLEPGAAIGPYERPSRFEKSVVHTDLTDFLRESLYKCRLGNSSGRRL